MALRGEALAPGVPPQEVAAQVHRLLEQVGVGGDRNVDRASGLCQLIVESVTEGSRPSEGVDVGKADPRPRSHCPVACPGPLASRPRR